MVASDFTFTNVHAYIALQIFTAVFHVDRNVITLSQFVYSKLKNQKEKSDQ